MSRGDTPVGEDDLQAYVDGRLGQNAHAMNGARLAIGHGAPLRLQVERQLGYKQAKYVMQLDVVASLSGIGGGKGEFWEDAVGYDWYAGI